MFVKKRLDDFNKNRKLNIFNSFNSISDFCGCDSFVYHLEYFIKMTDFFSKLNSSSELTDNFKELIYELSNYFLLNGQVNEICLYALTCLEKSLFKLKPELLFYVLKSIGFSCLILLRSFNGNMKIGFSNFLLVIFKNKLIFVANQEVDLKLFYSEAIDIFQKSCVQHSDSVDLLICLLELIIVLHRNQVPCTFLTADNLFQSFMSMKISNRDVFASFIDWKEFLEKFLKFLLLLSEQPIKEEIGLKLWQKVFDIIPLNSIMSTDIHLVVFYCQEFLVYSRLPIDFNCNMLSFVFREQLKFLPTKQAGKCFADIVTILSNNTHILIEFVRLCVTEEFLNHFEWVLNLLEPLKDSNDIFSFVQIFSQALVTIPERWKFNHIFLKWIMRRVSLIYPIVNFSFHLTDSENEFICLAKRFYSQFNCSLIYCDECRWVGNYYDLWTKWLV